MTWTATFPNGTLSVKANRIIGQGNTTYTQVTMGNTVANTTNQPNIRDHFWNVSANNDGRHRFINSPAFTIGGIPTVPEIGTGMDGVLYLKTTTDRAEWFHRNQQGNYQVTPSVEYGTVAISNSFINIGSALPANVYGKIFLYNDTNKLVQTGSFYTNATLAYCFSNRQSFKNTSNSYAIELSNSTDSVSLFIRGQRGNLGSSADGTYNFIITYRAI